MQKEKALAIIGAHEKELRKLDVARLSLFGAILHRDIREDEEVWALVEFARPVGLFEYVGVKQLLEEVLGHPVGLYTEDVLDPRDRERMLNEAVRAA